VGMSQDIWSQGILVCASSATQFLWCYHQIGLPQAVRRLCLVSSFDMFSAMVTKHLNGLFISVYV
jgi:hypothetical protein